MDRNSFPIRAYIIPSVIHMQARRLQTFGDRLHDNAFDDTGPAQECYNGSMQNHHFTAEQGQAA